MFNIIIQLKLIKKYEEERISILMKYDKKLIDLVKQIEGRKWSKSLNFWHIPNNNNLKEKLKNNMKIKFSNIIIQDLTIKEKQYIIDTNKSMSNFLSYLENRRYSSITINRYKELVNKFCSYFENDLNHIDIHKINYYINNTIVVKNYSLSYQNQVVNAIKLFFKINYFENVNIELLKRPKIPKKIPVVLSKEEIQKILKVTINKKHKLIISLAYSAGLRVSEIIYLEKNQIDFDRKVIYIRNSKGNRDRMVPLANKIESLMKDYNNEFKPIKYLFEGQDGGIYSTRSAQQVLKNGLKKANIKKLATFHSLRHSFATHLLENGTDLRVIQELLGHKSSKTTEIYTRVSNKMISRVISPFDQVDLE